MQSPGRQGLSRVRQVCSRICRFNILTREATTQFFVGFVSFLLVEEQRLKVRQRDTEASGNGGGTEMKTKLPRRGYLAY